VYDKLNSKCCENPSRQVFEIKEAVRKGKYEEDIIFIPENYLK